MNKKVLIIGAVVLVAAAALFMKNVSVKPPVPVNSRRNPLNSPHQIPHT